MKLQALTFHSYQLLFSKCFAGGEEFDAFLGETDILVSLLPATAETDGIINRSAIRKLSRGGPFGAPIVINAGRGRQQVASDIITCLDNGELHGATLDVFTVEPLPADDPLWNHPIGDHYGPYGG